jgi:hypothetical protein
LIRGLRSSATLSRFCNAIEVPNAADAVRICRREIEVFIFAASNRAIYRGHEGETRVEHGYSVIRPQLC